MLFARMSCAVAVVLAASLIFCEKQAYSQNLVEANNKRPKDPVRTELALLGERGASIDRARQATIDILEGDNKCSSWFRRNEPKSAAVFRTVYFRVDENGPSVIHKVQDDRNEWHFFEPYVASAIENATPPASIMINAHGAFFYSYAPVQELVGNTAPHEICVAKRIGVGMYMGNTLSAQITTMLHELGHILGILPVDVGPGTTPEMSPHNTETIVRACHAEIESAQKHGVTISSIQ